MDDRLHAVDMYRGTSPGINFIMAHLTPSLRALIADCAARRSYGT